MSFLKKAAKFILGGAIGGLLLGGKKKQPKMLPGPVTRDDAREATDQEDELLRRRGAAADLINGVQGAEPGTGSVGRLIVGS